MAGRIDMQFATIAPTLPYIRGGRLRALGVTGNARAITLPEVPTIADAALPGYVASLWLGLLAPAQTPPTVIDRLNADVVTALATAPLRQALIAQGFEPAASTIAAFAARIQNDTEKWQRVILAAGVHAE